MKSIVKYLKDFWFNLLLDIRENNKINRAGTRASRRQHKRIAGRKNPDGKYYGGVLPDGAHRKDRYYAGKREKV
jgi:hypothetical protein